MLEPLRRALGDARIVAVVPDTVAGLYERCPFINELIGVSFKLFNKPDFRDKVVAQLQAFNAEWCLSPAYTRTELGDFLAASSKAAQRIGHIGDVSRIRPEHREINNSRYTRLIPSPDPWKPELIRHADFLAGIGVPFEPGAIRPTMWIGPADELFADSIFQQHGLNPATTVALFAGAQLGVRKYQSYGKAIAPICQQRGLRLIALGGPEDTGINNDNLRDVGVPGVNLSGKTTLRQAAAILKRCRLAVGAETGLAHIACAMGTRNLVLLGGGHFGRFMPYSPLTTVACVPLECFGCNWECKYERVYCTWDLHPSVLGAAFAHALDRANPDRPVLFCQDAAAWASQNKLPTALPVLTTSSPGGPPKWAWPGQLLGRIPLEVWQVDPRGFSRKV